MFLFSIISKSNVVSCEKVIELFDIVVFKVLFTWVVELIKGRTSIKQNTKSRFFF